jgi:hypothetical protein
MMVATWLTPVVDGMEEAPISPRRGALNQLRWADPSPPINFVDFFQDYFFVVFAKIQMVFS